MFIFIYFLCLVLYFIRFPLELDKFSVDIQVLKDPVIVRKFVGWTEDWEKELKKNNCPVVKASFLTK